MPSTKEEIEFQKKIGQRIVQLRKGCGLKQIELAISLNIEDSALRRIEAGKTNFTTRTLFRIAKQLDVTLSELVDV